MKVLILGASGNVGAAVARVLHYEGWELALHGYRGKERLGDLAVETNTPDEDVHLADLTIEAAVSSLFSSVGQLDAIVNAVGVNPTASSVVDLDLNEWQSVIDVNLTATFLTLKHGIPSLDKSKMPSIVLVSSIFGVETPERRAAYGASKHATTALVQAVNREEGDWLRVNAVCPGPMWSENVRSIFAKHAKADGVTVEQYVMSRLADIPAGRFTELRECAQVIAFLLNPRSSAIQGELFRVTGGAIR